jgi:hypothetical protein
MAHVPAAALPEARARIGAIVLGLFMLYLIGLDQGLLLSVVQGELAFDQNFIHELVHDARHTAAFPCH